MIAEKITVTATLTSLQDLINTARIADEVHHDVALTKCSRIKLKYDADETASIKIAETGTVTPVAVLDAANGLYMASIEAFDFSQISLQTSTGSVDVEVIVEQPRM